MCQSKMETDKAPIEEENVMKEYYKKVLVFLCAVLKRIRDTWRR